MSPASLRPVSVLEIAFTLPKSLPRGFPRIIIYYLTLFVRARLLENAAPIHKGISSRCVDFQSPQTFLVQFIAKNTKY